ncbi:MAG: hydrogenase expression/formation protein HypE [Actinomycetota bacterium]|nr:hydrogenase expression/formation protein HypE [Actinomycetota bacterium]
MTQDSQDIITLGHGSGGKLSAELVSGVFLPFFKSSILNKLDDSAVISPQKGRVAFTTDSYVIDPIFFKGGDIGKLAVCGTVNDLAMSGATPRYLSASFLIEAGFPLTDLKRIAWSMAVAAEEAKVEIVTGDTKVVEAGSADKLFINTAGLGFIEDAVDISASKAKVKDLIIISGTIGDHGISIMSEREGLRFETDILSDCAPLNHLVAAMMKVSRNIRVLRDPTRGGLATVLNEIAAKSNVGICLEEANVPVKSEVKGACELLGLDPLYVANEGKLLAVVAKSDAEKVLEAMRTRPEGREAAIIGEVVETPKKKVFMRTPFGTARLVDLLVGEQLPRIC